MAHCYCGQNWFYKINMVLFEFLNKGGNVFFSVLVALHPAHCNILFPGRKQCVNLGNISSVSWGLAATSVDSGYAGRAHGIAVSHAIITSLGNRSDFGMRKKPTVSTSYILSLLYKITRKSPVQLRLMMGSALASIQCEPATYRTTDMAQNCTALVRRLTIFAGMCIDNVMLVWNMKMKADTFFPSYPVKIFSNLCQ